VSLWVYFTNEWANWRTKKPKMPFYKGISAYERGFGRIALRPNGQA
jgi:hypothetical protein